MFPAADWALRNQKRLGRDSQAPVPRQGLLARQPGTCPARSARGLQGPSSPIASSGRPNRRRPGASCAEAREPGLAEPPAGAGGCSSRFQSIHRPAAGALPGPAPSPVRQAGEEERSQERGGGVSIYFTPLPRVKSPQEGKWGGTWGAFRTPRCLQAELPAGVGWGGRFAFSTPSRT